MEKYIVNERTGREYELKGDCYSPTGRIRKNGVMVPEKMLEDDRPEDEYQPIGVFGQRHLQYIK